MRPRKKRPSNSTVRPGKPRPVAKAKAKARKLQVATPGNSNQADRVRPPRNVRENSRVWIGADLSLHSLALAALGWDEVLKEYRGPVFHVINWKGNDHYFDRIARLSKADYIYEPIAQMNMIVDSPQIYIAQEEPWPFGMANRGKGQSQTLKQQAEMSGAFLAGCLRLGFTNIYQIHNTWWRKIVADDLGITVHHTKWGKGIEGKMRCKEWSLDFNLAFEEFRNPVPVWPDLIADSKNGGRMPQPENSRAKPLQPDDRYQALPMAVWAMREERGQSPENFSEG